jgi:hypothetical protein
MKRVTLGLAQAVNLFSPDVLNDVDLFEPVSKSEDGVVLGVEGYKKIISLDGKIQSFLTRKDGDVLIKEKHIPAVAAQVVVAVVAGEVGGELSVAQRENLGVLNLLTEIFNVGAKSVFVS